MKRFTLAFFLFVAGIVLIIFHNYPDVLKGIAVFIGVMMILPASISVCTAALSRRAERISAAKERQAAEAAKAQEAEPEQEDNADAPKDE